MNVAVRSSRNRLVHSSVSIALACALCVSDAFRRANAEAGAPGPLFVDLPADSGLNFVHVNGATGQYYMPEVMGSGGALFDYDQDGDLDVFLVQSGSFPVQAGSGAGSPTSNGTAHTSRLFRNDLVIGRDGRRTLRFTDVTATAGVGLRSYGMGATVGDYDNDGDLDLFVTAFGPDTLYRNDGDGTFTDVTHESNTSDDRWSTSAAFVDYDRDGDLDLFVANYLDFTPATNKLCYDAVGARDYCTPRAYRPVPDRLLRNEGHGRFADVTDAAGITRADGPGLGVSTGDYDGDGWLDLYVANDSTPNQLWINQKNGTFLDSGPVSGAAVNAAGNPEGSMGIASGDFDADGDEDLFITNIAGETYAFYVNTGRGDFDDARVRVGVAQPTAAVTGFGTDFFDYDNDGWLDLFIANGAVNIIESQRGDPFPFRMKNQLLRNLGTGRFADASALAGPVLARAEVSRGAAFGDVDNDGDLDVLVTNNSGPTRLLLNQARRSDAGHHWLQIRLEQPAGNRFAVGARVGIERAGQPTIWRRVRSDGSYLSASDLRVHVGLGRSPAVDAVIVEWPDGGSIGEMRERWTNVQADRLVTLRRGTGSRMPSGRIGGSPHPNPLRRGEGQPRDSPARQVAQGFQPCSRAGLAGLQGLGYQGAR
jgi:enediyne biosynthesis protein E4